MYSHFMRPRNRLYISAAFMANVAAGRAALAAADQAFLEAVAADNARDLVTLRAAGDRALRQHLIAEQSARDAIAAGEVGAEELEQDVRLASVLLDALGHMIEGFERLQRSPFRHK